jgi:hypothetical protein
MRSLLFVFVISLSLIAVDGVQSNIEMHKTELIKPKNQKVIAIRLGQNAVEKLKIELKRNIQSQIKNGGLSKALSFCSENAQILTTKIESSIGQGIKIKRISKKFRNLKNAPDYIDTLAYSYFDQMYDRDKKYPSHWIAKLRNKQNHDDVYYRYYHPIKVKKSCLNCHGTNIDNNLLKEIRMRYPNDQAVQFKINDLRGFFVVEIAPEALKKQTTTSFQSAQ